MLSVLLLLCSCHQQVEKKQASRPQTPAMGWASWNNYRVSINEDIIKAQAKAMVSSGMAEAGYQYINVDDGYFGGRDTLGNLLVHPTRFPSGMKALAAYIHSLGLKAGLYSDAGINTCATFWDKDSVGLGVGLYGHEQRDLELMLTDWKYDYIKVDWCGGDWMGLNDELAYTRIGTIVRALRPDVLYNVCRWQFPGEWIVNTADSWRISQDIANTYESVMGIVDQNEPLWKYSGAGHFNDMDMLQVGRGMSYEEDKTHFTMWCMMNSPLMAGNDLTRMSAQTVEILTNKDLIAINQDTFCYQARRLVDQGETEIWGRPLVSSMSGEVAVTVVNRSLEEMTVDLTLSEIGIDASAGYKTKDLWSKEIASSLSNEIITAKVPAHGVIALRISGKSLPFNVYQKE